MAKNQPFVTVILLAAGGSTRMQGRDKLLEPIDSLPLLARTEAACQASNAEEVIAVLRPGDPARRQVLTASTKQTTNANWEKGMATSIQTGLAAASPGCTAILIVLADMPELSAADLNSLIDAYRPDRGKTLVRAISATGIPGHPVLIGKAHFNEIASLQGDRGARELLKAHANAIALVSTPGENALIDLDTPADWAAYRAKP